MPADHLWEILSGGAILAYLWLTDDAAKVVIRLNPHLTLRRFSP